MPRGQGSKVNVAICGGSKVGGACKERDSETEYARVQICGKGAWREGKRQWSGVRRARETGDPGEKTERERDLLVIRAQSPGLSLSVT